MIILPKAIYRFNEIPIKLLVAFFTEIEQRQRQKSQIFMEKQKKKPNSQRNLEKEKWSRRIRLSEFRLHYNATVIKKVWY